MMLKLLISLQNISHFEEAIEKLKKKTLNLPVTWELHNLIAKNWSKEEGGQAEGR